MRQAQAQNGFAAVLAKGDPSAGAILVILAEKGRKLRILERLLGSGEDYQWRDATSHDIGDDDETQKFLDRRRRHDPDLWLIELDVPSAERFAAEMNSSN